VEFSKQNALPFPNLNDLHKKYVVHYSKAEAVFGTADFDLKSILSVNKVA
jgi:hypothetical protein